MMECQIHPGVRFADGIQCKSKIIQGITKFTLFIALSIQQRLLAAGQHHMRRVSNKMCQNCTGITQRICTVNNHKMLDLPRLQLLNKLYQLQPVSCCTGTTVLNGGCMVAFDKILLCEYLFELWNK